MVVYVTMLLDIPHITEFVHHCVYDKSYFPLYLVFTCITCTLPVNMSVKASASIIKLYEFFNMARLLRIITQTNPLPKNAREAITPNVILRLVREWWIWVLFTAESVSFMESCMTVCCLSNRCYLAYRRVMFG